MIGFVFAGFSAAAQPARQVNPLGNGLDVVQTGRTLFNKTCTGCDGADAGASMDLHWPVNVDFFG